VTGIIVFILTGISVFLAPILKVRLCTPPRAPTPEKAQSQGLKSREELPHSPDRDH
jgi:hypothetical protein